MCIMWARAVLLSSFWRARVKLTLKVWVWAVLRHARDASTELLSRWYPAQAGSAEVSSAAPLRLVEGPENEMEGGGGESAARHWRATPRSQNMHDVHG